MRRLLVTMAAVLLAADAASAGVLAHRRLHYRSAGATVDAYEDFATELAYYWAFEDAAGAVQQDYVGANPLAADADATSETGMRDKAYGVNGNVTVEATDVAATQPTTGLALSGWVNINTTRSGNIVAFGKASGADGPYYLSASDTGGDGSIKFYAAVHQSDGTLKYAESAETYVEDTWYHLVQVADGTTVYLYVNGVHADAEAFDGSFKNDAQECILYAGGASASILDEVAYWNDIAFASAEERQAFVTDLYNAGTGHFLGDAYTVLLVHGDGADASTTFWDAGLASSANPHAITANGNAQVDTAQSKFGGASVLFDGTGDYQSVPDSSDWDFGSGDFTIDLWFRFASVDAYTIWVENHLEAGNQRAWQFYHQQSDNTLRFTYSVDGVNVAHKTVSWTPSTGTWYHVATVRSGNDLKFFVDGTQVGSTQDVTGVGIFASSASLLVMGHVTTAYGAGWLDELRISKGIARWTANFTAPTAAYLPE